MVEGGSFGSQQGPLLRAEAKTSEGIGPRLFSSLILPTGCFQLFPLPQVKMGNKDEVLALYLLGGRGGVWLSVPLTPAPLPALMKDIDLMRCLFPTGPATPASLRGLVHRASLGWPCFLRHFPRDVEGPDTPLQLSLRGDPAPEPGPLSPSLLVCCTPPAPLLQHLWSRNHQATVDSSISFLGLLFVTFMADCISFLGHLLARLLPFSTILGTWLQ